MKIYIVDDNEHFRNDLKLFLEEYLNHEVIGEASDGEKFLQNPDYRADVILMDISMPSINGIEATKLGIWENAHLKVIAISQYQELADLETIISAGFKGFVNKGNLYRDLNTAIEKVAAGELFIPDEIH